MRKKLNNKNQFKEISNAAGISSKPFYLKRPKDNAKAIIVSGLMLLVMCIISPYILIVMPVYLAWAFTQLKKYKSESNILLEQVINLYENQRYVECKEELNKLLALDSKNDKAKIIFALIKYDEEKYEEVIHLLSTVPTKIIDNDLDLQIKLADCYVKIGKKENAKALYKRLSKIYDKSSYIKETLKKLN